MCPMNAGSSRRRSGPAWSLAVAVTAGLLLGTALPRPFEPVRAAQQPTTQQPPIQGGASVGENAPPDPTDAEPAPAIATRTFEAPAAMVINYIRAGSESSFEQLTSRLVESLAASEDPERQAQAAGWTMYRVREPGPNNNAVYVWLLNPAVAGANYAVPQLLNETFPEEVQQLYETFNQSFGLGQTLLNLDPVVLVQELR